MAKRKTTPLAPKWRDSSSDELPVKQRSSRPNGETITWWTEELGKNAQGSLWAWIDRLRSTWSQDAINDLIAEAIYQDTPISAMSRYDGTRWLNSMSAMNPLNAIKSLVDTATARLTKLRSMPCISADDANYDEKLFAQETSRVLRRKMGSGEFEMIAPLIIRDFVVRGTAVGYVERHGGDTDIERAQIYEIVFDHRECLYGPPRSLARVRPVNRRRLIERYPRYAKQIEKAPAYSRQDPWIAMTYTGPNLSDMVELAEAWHPPSGPTADDGQHIVAVRGATIAREPWNCVRYPLDFCYWTPPWRSIRGSGLVVEMAPAQEMINDILRDAREALHHGSQLKIFAPRGTVNKHQLRARHPAVIEIDGAQPSYVAPNPVSQQAWNIAFQILEEMHNLSGISRWATSSKSPLGQGVSGKALDTMNDNQSDRFAHVESGYQQFRVGMGMRTVDRARMMYDEAFHPAKRAFEEQPDPFEKNELASWIRDHEWPEVDIDGGNYHLVLEPVNYLASSREGRLEDVAELAKAGLIPDPTMTAELFDEPDLVSINRPILGPIRRIRRCLSDLTDLKVPYINCAPDNYTNVALAELLASGELEDLRSHKKFDPRIEQRFMDYLADVKRIKSQGAKSLAGAQANNVVAQQNAADMMGGGAPPMPGAPPAGPPGAPPMPPMPPPGIT